MPTMPMSARSSSRNGATVRWIGIHTSEGTSYGARGLRDATWWEGSSHAISDDKELLDHNSGCVHPDRYAWTLRNGNPKSVNIEQVAYAKWSRDEWLNNHMPMLRNTARWIADMAARFNIPITYIGTQGVRDNAFGVIQHNDYSVGTGDGTHWDCGLGWPVDVVIDLAREFANPSPVPVPVPTRRKASTMFLYRRNPTSKLPGETAPAGVSGVRLHTGPITSSLNDGEAAEIGKALQTGDHVALVSAGLFAALAK